MRDKAIPDGGRYTRPRRGFRSKSHYRDRLRKRGLTSRDVRMDSLDALRKKQGAIPGPANGLGSKGPTYKALRRAYSGVQMPRRMPKVAPYNASPEEIEV